MKKIYGYNNMKKVVGIPTTRFTQYNNYNNYNGNRQSRRQQERGNRRDTFKDVLRRQAINNYQKTYKATSDAQIIYLREYAKTRNSRVYGQLNSNSNNKKTDIIDFQKRISQIDIPLRKPQIPERKSYTSTDSNIIYFQEYSRTRNSMIYSQINAKCQAKYNTGTISKDERNKIRSLPEYKQNKITTSYKNSNCAQVIRQQPIRSTSKREEVNTFKNSIKAQANIQAYKNAQNAKMEKTIIEFQKALEQKRRYDEELKRNRHRGNRRNTGFER